MILCVDTHAIKSSPCVQKDVNLEDILLNHTKYYDTIEEAVKDYYVPISFSTSVRTVYTNQVLQITEGDNRAYYVNYTNIGKFVHKGYDLIMYLSAIGLMSYVNYFYAFDDMMVKHSTLQPIGLYNPDAGFFNPVIYSHVIIADEAVDTLKTFLKPEASLVPISTMREEIKQNKKSYVSALLDTLILIERKKGK